MKNQYNNLEKILEKGSCVVVKDLSDNTYCSIINHKDKNENYRNSDWCNSVKESKQWIGHYSGYSKQGWDDIDLEIVEVFRPEEKLFEVGDKVRILDSIKKTDDWESVEDKFPDMIGEVKRVYYNMVGTHYKVNGLSVGHEFLAPLVEEEVEELTMEQICKELGREVKIKK